MRTATLTRRPIPTNAGTFGDWVSDSGFNCITLERMRTGEFPCIPVGSYHCELRYSPKHKHRDFGYGVGMVYGVKDVPGRKDILIHPANFVFEIRGCIAPGKSIAEMHVEGSQVQTGIVSSKLATVDLMRDMAGEPFILTIKEKENAGS